MRFLPEQIAVADIIKDWYNFWRDIFHDVSPFLLVEDVEDLGPAFFAVPSSSLRAPVIPIIIIVVAILPFRAQAFFFPFAFNLTRAADNFLEFSTVEPDAFTVRAEVNQDAGLGGFLQWSITVGTHHGPFLLLVLRCPSLMRSSV
jgi:hypothetical protein